MMWDQVLLRIVGIVTTDAMLAEIYGEHMRMVGSGDFQIPSLEWSLVSDSEQELWAPCVVQFDQWSEDSSAVVRSERRLRALFHQDLPAEFDGLIMTCTYIDGSVLASPDRDGFVGRAIRFQFTPLRSKYALSAITHTP